MSETAIRVAGLGKQYRIGARQDAHQTLAEALTDAVKAPIRAVRALPGLMRGRAPPHETIWALKDISFDVKAGEVVGIIGRNGAGKSTLLKILSRITEPSTGYAQVYGRVGSLLEVGTGFHPELTGRDNVLLNGAILGMKKSEIVARFDEIVAFSEVGAFIDTPVKHYSSGMYLRLAFAVAAHLHPGVLVVDEVLSVGDAEFQAKCMGKMQKVASEGRTILLVSHNMAAICNLCTRALHIERGKLVGDGPVAEVARRYIGSSPGSGAVNVDTTSARQGAGSTRFHAVRFEDEHGNNVGHAISGSPLVFALHYRSGSAEPLRNCRVSIAVYDQREQVLFNCSTELTDAWRLHLPSRGTIRCIVPRLPLTQGIYRVSVFFEVDREIQDWIDNAASLAVGDGDFFGSGKLYPDGWRGTGVLVDHSWTKPSAETELVQTRVECASISDSAMRAARDVR